MRIDVQIHVVVRRSRDCGEVLPLRKNGVWTEIGENPISGERPATAEANRARGNQRVGGCQPSAKKLYTLADVCNFAIANGMQNGFADLVNEKDTPHLVAWIHRINERPACKLMFAKQPSEWANRRRE
jgi:hypothetical protein